MTTEYQIAVYYFPNYHVDPRNERWHGKGWTEWELVKNAKPRFEGHQQPKIPLWGYEDEADPNIMRKKIDVAVNHGIDSFIFDWYWYDDGPYLNRPLDEAFLSVTRHDPKLKFGIMWANHDWVDIHPWKYKAPQTLQAPGKFSPQTWERATDYMAEHYFTHPACWKIEGRPYFSIYEATKFLESFGSIDAARRGIERLDAKAKAAGCEGIHCNMVYWGTPILPGETSPAEPDALTKALGCVSVTSYVWIHHHWPSPFPRASYEDMMAKSMRTWDELDTRFTLPYYPNVSMGWDSSPRACQSDIFEDIGYPFSPVLMDNTPDNFMRALTYARDWLDRKPKSQRILTVNSWNEWTEGSYLEPDIINGMRYLEAIRTVFPKL